MYSEFDDSSMDSCSLQLFCSMSSSQHINVAGSRSSVSLPVLVTSPFQSHFQKTFLRL